MLRFWQPTIATL